MKIHGIMGQSAPSATSLTAAYTVGSHRHATVRVLVCNRGLATTFRIAVSPDGETIADKHYVAYDQMLVSGDSVSSVAFTVNETDVVRVYSDSGEVSFTITGIEDSND